MCALVRDRIVEHVVNERDTRGDGERSAALDERTEARALDLVRAVNAFVEGDLEGGGFHALSIAGGRLTSMR